MNLLKYLPILLLLIACKDKAKDFSQKNGTQKNQGEFFVAFNELDKDYCNEQKK